MNIEKAKEIIQEWNKCEELVIRENSDYDKTIYIQRKEAMETLLSELEKKEAIINEMAEWINRIDSTIFCNKSECNDNCEECVIKEFTKKVEDK